MYSDSPVAALLVPLVDSAKRPVMPLHNWVQPVSLRFSALVANSWTCLVKTNKAGGLGINDISNVQGNAVADRQIWNPDAYRSDPRAAGFEAQQEFGGFGIGKGETMFGENTGDEIRKQVEEMFYKARCAGCAKPECIGKMTCPYGHGDTTMKAKCPGCGKENCVNKMGCTAKADDDKKKPAHGMVIVIGSKAGPGPSKDGKREKLDSEKKED